MRTNTAAVVSVLALALAGCSSEETITMPDVVGMHLDVAKTTIEQAGFRDEVEIDGGGTFGVVVESNWLVCAQSVAPGADLDDSAVTLTVDRECADDSDSEASSDATPTALDPATAPDVVGTTLDVAEEMLDGYLIETYDTSGDDRSVWVASNWTVTAQRVEGDTLILDIQNYVDVEAAETDEPTAETTTLTVENNADLAALLNSPENSDRSAAFAANYAGQNIEFDAVIAAMANHGSYTTRYDILISAGDDANTATNGPSFQFNDVSIVGDLNLVGDNIPDTIGVNTKLHVIATVGEFSSVTLLFQLDPVETSVR